MKNIYCYNVNDFNGSITFLKLFRIKLENKPIAEYWKTVEIFNSMSDFLKYCEINAITDVKQNQFAVPNKVEYF